MDSRSSPKSKQHVNMFNDVQCISQAQVTLLRGTVRHPAIRLMTDPYSSYHILSISFHLFALSKLLSLRSSDFHPQGSACAESEDSRGCMAPCLEHHQVTMCIPICQRLQHDQTVATGSLPRHVFVPDLKCCNDNTLHRRSSSDSLRHLHICQNLLRVPPCRLVGAFLRLLGHQDRLDAPTAGNLTC